MFTLLVFEPASTRILRQDTYSEIGEAAVAYRDAERENFFGTDREVVLVGTSGIESLYTTHGHYFRGVLDSQWSWLLEGL